MSSMVAQDRSDQATALVDTPPAQRKRVVTVGGGDLLVSLLLAPCEKAMPASIICGTNHNKKA